MPDKSPARLLFTYGTLKRRGRLHGQVMSQGARYRGNARIRGQLFKISGTSYPGAIPTRSDNFVTGELYELETPAQALKAIDRLEGCDEGLYVRKLVGAWIGEDRKVRAWAYFYNKPLRKSRLIPSGQFPVKRRASVTRSRGAA
jgi:gamma-glutamylcyclotransferase (GGCT)/AIG2-like uncharacterized protein YtfP